MDSKEERDRGPLEFLERAWGQALVAVSSAEEEVAKLVQRLSGAANWSQDEIRRQAREMTERLSGQRRDLEKNLEDKVRAALAVLRVPKREELTQLTRRLETLSERVEQLKRA